MQSAKASKGGRLRQQEVRAAFLRRATAALERIATGMPTGVLADALTAPTDVGAVARLIARADLVGPAVAELDPLAPAIARGAEHREALRRAAGGMLSAEAAGRLLGISRQAIDKRRRNRGLLAMREGGDWRYPACQFDQERAAVVEGIGAVVRAFEREGPWIALDVLLAPDSALGGRSPLAALRAGDEAAVARLLRAEGADGFA